MGPLGSGNNWARGYNTYGTQVRDAALELARRETEACDHLGGFLLMQSMAGGTGAGLGAYVAQAWSCPSNRVRLFCSLASNRVCSFRSRSSNWLRGA